MSRSLIQPDFMDRFACKCAACHRSCCNGDWTIIQITRNEFLAAHDPALGTELHMLAEQGLRRNTKSTSDEDYAYCIQNTNGLCTFLTEDGLCLWKCISGSYIGSTCDDFPRSSLLYCDDAFLFPTCACEKVLEMLLAKEDPIKLIADKSSSDRTTFNTTIDETNFEKRSLLKYYPLLMQTGLNILQDRTRCLDERMTILAQLMSLIDYLEKQEDTEEIPAAIERFMQPDNYETAAHRYSQLDIGPQALLVTTAQMLTLLSNIPDMHDFAITAMQGIGVQFDQSDAKQALNDEIPPEMGVLDIDVYCSRKTALKSYLEDKEIFLEHIMVCEYLRGLIPCTYNDVWVSFRAFNTIYAYHKALLCGMFEAPPSDEQLIDVYVTLHRKIIHSPDLMNQILEQAAYSGLVDLSAMVALANG